MDESGQDQTLGETQIQDRVNLVASSEDTASAHLKSSADGAGYFETAHWSADGTTILTSSSSDIVSAYILPRDLLEGRAQPLTLDAQASISLGERTNVLASAPYFNLSEGYTNQILVNSRDHPIQLYYLFPPSVDGVSKGTHSPSSSYPLIKERSETFLTANSLLWSAPGSHFIAGCKNFLAKFDITRTGEEPLLRIKTIPSERHISKGNGVGMRGTVSTLAAQSSDQGQNGLVSAGTWTRWIGLYDFAQAGECAATWGISSAVKQTAAGDGLEDIGGDGITQTIWSPCGRYLLVSERKSRGILVYDVRVTGQLLGWLTGRDASSNQRIACDVFPAQAGYGGFEVWSGTTAGTVKVWEGVGLTAGAQNPSWDWQAHESTVSSACLHHTGSVIATCSGSWDLTGKESPKRDRGSAASSDTEARTSQDNRLQKNNRESTLKVWSMASIPQT